MEKQGVRKTSPQRLPASRKARPRPESASGSLAPAGAASRSERRLSSVGKPERQLASLRALLGMTSVKDAKTRQASPRGKMGSIAQAVCNPHSEPGDDGGRGGGPVHRLVAAAAPNRRPTSPACCASSVEPPGKAMAEAELRQTLPYATPRSPSSGSIGCLRRPLQGAASLMLTR